MKTKKPAVLKPAPSERKTRFTTLSGLELERLYTSKHLAGIDFVEDIGFPGQYPYTRGIHPTMYRGRPWTMRQYAGFGTAEESNRRYHYLLEQGQTGLSVAFDLPTQMGYDADEDRARGEVGKVGVSICSIDDMRTLLKGLPLSKVSSSMTINATAAILLALYIAVAEEQGVGQESLSGTVQNDILKEYIARGTYIYPPEHALRLVVDIIEYGQKKLPRWNTISISGYHIREAGATAVQELAFTLANARAYVQAALQRGLKIDDFAPRISFFFNVQNDFLEELAKFRAARRMWARITRKEFGAKNPRSMMLRFHAQTAGASLTAQQPDNNIVRVTLQALAAVLGGTQSLHSNSKDEALGLPTEDSALIALRTQQIILHESGAANTADPVAGSYTVESLTKRLEEEAGKIIGRIDRMGGMLATIQKGLVQSEIHESAYRYQLALEKGEQYVVGVNRYRDERPAAAPALARSGRKPPVVDLVRTEQIRRFKGHRNAAASKAALSELREGAAGKDNLVPLILTAVKAGATLGEISHAFRAVFGTHDR